MKQFAPSLLRESNDANGHRSGNYDRCNVLSFSLPEPVPKDRIGNERLTLGNSDA
jgi:hypothetical protein